MEKSMYSTLKWFINMIYFNSEELKLRILENKELSNRWKKFSKSSIFTASCTTLPTPPPPPPHWQKFLSNIEPFYF